MQRSISRLLLVALLCSLAVISLSSVVYATTETRYFRNSIHTINDLTAFQLGIAQSSTSNYSQISLTGTYTAYWQILVYIRKSDSSETYVGTSGTVSRASNGEGLQNKTWGCPQKTLSVTDAIRVRVYMYLYDPYYGEIVAESYTDFITERLGETQLDAATWNIYLYTYRNAVGGGATTARFYFGSSSYDSRILNFSHSTPVSKSWHSVASWSSTLLAKQWLNVSTWSFSFQTMQWNSIALWLFNLQTLMWNDIASWVFGLGVMAWNTIVYWQITLQIMAWQNIGLWMLNLASLGLHTVAHWIFSVTAQVTDLISLGLSSLGFVLCLMPLTHDDDTVKALAIVALILCLAGLVFSVLGLSYAFAVGGLAFVMAVSTFALYIVKPKKQD